MASNYLSALIGAGNDAHSNLYVVKFTGSGLDSEDLSIRCSGVEIPAYEQESYPVKFVTATIDRPSSKINLDRTLNFTFRVGANFKSYKTLLEAQRKYFDPVDHKINAHIADSDLFQIDVYYLKDSISSGTSRGGNSSGITDDLSNENNKIATFEQCWITNIAGLAFNTDSAAPVSVAVTVKFKNMIEAPNSALSATNN